MVLICFSVLLTITLNVYYWLWCRNGPPAVLILTRNWASLMYLSLSLFLSRRHTLRSRQNIYLSCCCGWFLLLPHTCRLWASESSPTVCASARRSSAKSSPLWCRPLHCPLVRPLPQLPLPLETKMTKWWEQTIKWFKHVLWINTQNQINDNRTL